jgi:hypothetical protein
MPTCASHRVVSEADLLRKIEYAATRASDCSKAVAHRGERVKAQGRTDRST